MNTRFAITFALFFPFAFLYKRLVGIVQLPDTHSPFAFNAGVEWILLLKEEPFAGRRKKLHKIAS